MKKETQKKIINEIIRIRTSQLIINEKIKGDEFKIPMHLGLGHETIAVAVDTVMSKADYLFLTHRNMHYNLARTDSLKKEIDEYYLKENGMANARLGSMNLSNKNNGIPYSSSILGNNLSVATGFALANEMLSDDGIIFVVTGDGAIEEGSFYESLLFQRSNNLRVIIIIENNEWSLGSKISERRCEIDLEKITDSLDIPFKKISGNNPFDYINQLNDIKIDVVKNNLPFCLEVEIKTLGYWHEVQPDYPEGKFINYHAGKAPNTSISNNPIIENSENDPIFVLKNIIGEKLFFEYFNEHLSKLTEEIK